MEDSASAPFITSIYTWFTPTVLFIFLNLMIATILFTSNLPNKPQLNDQKAPDQSDNLQPKLHSSPSILHRLKSFTLYPPRSQQEQPPPPLELAATQYVFNHPFTQEQDLQPDQTRFDSDPNDLNTHFVENHNTHFESGSGCEETGARPELELELDEENDELESLDEVYSKITGGNVNRTKSDTLPASGEVPVRLPAKMKKSASLKSAFGHFEEGKIVEARRPATVRGRRTAKEDDDVEVDAKADDFINKFKEQLKLQRLDSIMRYKDMVNRGGGK